MKRKLTGIPVCLLFLLLNIHLSTQAQNKAISGKVTNNKNEPITGASVVVRNRPSTGTTTNTTGAFTLNVAPGDDSLTISAIGYDMLTVAISGNLQVSLSTGRISLDEVVVIGYGTQRRADLTAPITTVNTENMLKRNTVTAMDALQGSVPGVQVVSSGAPGSSPNVRIRGVGSFNNENPLYVVDGMF
ncbi:MAG TPA: carboxypeptidase-like regulatory domain-containing protein, partial [Puia sp.]